MIYPYLVVHNGVEYPAGVDVPNDRQEENVVSSENATEPAKERTITKTEINRTPLNELKVLAGEYGIENADTKSGSALKKELIEALGL